MGILEKLGLVENDEPEITAGLAEPPQPAEVAPLEPAILENVTESEMLSVAALYEKTGLADLSKSIYQVEELKNALPASLDQQSIKQSVLGVMKVAGLALDQVLADAGQRTQMLQGAGAKLTGEIQDLITQNLTEIAQLEARVNELKQINNQKKKLQEEQTAALTLEIAKIESIVRFIS